MAPGRRWGGRRGNDGDGGSRTQPCIHFKKGRCRYGDKCRFSHDISDAAGSRSDTHRSFDDLQAREDYHEWKRLLRKNRHHGFGTMSTSTQDALGVWVGALAILDGDSEENRHLLARDLVSDDLNGQKYIKDTAQMNSFTRNEGIRCAQSFLKVITHPSLLSPLSIDHYVGTMYAIFGGPNGERGVDFLSRLCLSVMKDQDSSGISHPSIQRMATVISAALYQLLNRVSRAQFCDNLPALLEPLGKLVENIGKESPGSDFDALQGRLNIITRVVDGAAGRVIAAKPPSDNEHDAQPVSSSFPKHVEIPGGRHDNDFADISDVAIMPTYGEITSDNAEYLPPTNFLHPHVIEDPMQRYIDSMFRLVRHDTFGPVKEILRDVLSWEDLSKGWLSNKDTQAQTYSNSAIRRISIDQKQGLEVVVSFLAPPHIRQKSPSDQRSWWQASPRLGEGTLVCFVSSQSDRQDLLFLQVTAKTTDDTSKQGKLSQSTLVSKQHLPSITVKLATHQPSDLSLLFQLWRDRAPGALVDFNGVIPGTFMPILKNLQKIKRENHIAFQQWILPGTSANDNMPPPLYARKAGFVFPLGCIAKDGKKNIQLDPSSPKTINLQELEDATGLDGGQCLGLLGALTREYALIQGPPGTGKSYLGVQLVRALLAVKDRAELGPILVVCYTNHALDQFLKHLLGVGIQSIIRIGGRSVAEELDGKNLRVVSKETPKTNVENQILGKSYGELESSTKAAKHAMRPLHQARKGPSWAGLKQFLAHNHPAIYDQLKLDQPGGFTTVSKDPLITWLGKRPNDTPRPSLSPQGLREMKALARRAGQSIDALTRTERWTLAETWLEQQQESQVGILFESIDECENYRNAIHKTHDAVDQRTLARAEVIGMTTTSLARNVEMLRNVGIKVAIGEEAAEIKEPDWAAALIPGVQHVIQIGDHKQLRPQINNFSLSLESASGKMWQLDRSQFERRAMGEPGLKPAPFAQLNVQRRMRPDISKLIRRVYPNLQDHESVADLPDVIGMRRNLFWLNHNHMEDTGGDGTRVKSHSNLWETKMATALVRHLVRQGEYKTEDIALLTPYTGQLQQLRAALSKDFEICLSDRDQERLAQEGFEDESGATKTIEKKQLLQTIRLATVDNFQGEEAKVIVVSLVRSNQQRKVGFLRTENRINVLLSRAQHGMYLIGNSETYLNVPMWAEVHNQLSQAGAVGTEIELRCPRHPDTTLVCAEPEDFAIKCPEGGCNLACSRRLEPCGHMCQARCHSAAMHDAISCQQPCPRVRKTCDHKCPKLCGDNCGLCRAKVHDIELPCGHIKATLLCHQTLDLSQIRCTAQVEKKCPSFCGEDCPVGYCQQCGEKDEARVDLLEFQSYSEVNLDESPIVVLGCGHFFTGETLDGLVSLGEVYTTDKEGNFNGLKDMSGSLARNVPFCPDCKRPIRQFATKRYNRLINRAVMDEICKRFLIKGRKCLDALEENLQKMENALGSSRPLHTPNEGVPSLPKDRYSSLKKLRAMAKRLTKRMDESHQPTKMLIDAIAISRTSTNGDTLSITRQMEALKLSSPGPDKQLILGAQLVTIKVQEVQFQDVIALLKALKGAVDDGLARHWFNDQPLPSMERFFPDCEDLINKAKEAKLPRTVIAATLAFARVSQLSIWWAQTGEADGVTSSEKKDSVTLERTDTARELLNEALAQCSGFEGSDNLKERVQETMRLFESRYEQVTPEELASIKSAIVSGGQGINTHSGHWYNCANGHPFAIGECGMPMELARCPECGAQIGGTHHRAVDGVTRDEYMERA
ncbi:hypothetical protein ACHAPT_012640 [Fusarium lateritium]